MCNGKQYWILMADVAGSRQQPGIHLAAGLAQLTAYLNEVHKASILSPLTVTLGDEFQAVVKDRSSGIGIIVAAEEWLIAKQYPWKLRYVLWYGAIDTPINADIAHGMLGEGLTMARLQLQQLKQDKKTRFFVFSHSKHQGVYNQYFLLMEAITRKWKPKDYYLLEAFFKFGDYKKVAKALQKDPSLMWKRHQTLQLSEYEIIRSLLLHPPHDEN